MVGRLTQSIFEKHEARIEIYTDDPCIAVAGTKKQRDRLVACVVLLWRALGFPLSWHKGSRGRRVDWIGGEFDIMQEEPRGVKVKIKQEIFDESSQVVEKFIHSNVIGKKPLRSCVGKLSHIPNLILVWRPFLTPLYGALYGPAGDAPANCIWTKQIMHPLKWFNAFFKASGGFVERTFLLSNYLDQGDRVEIVIDASPWGLAGILVVGGVCVEYFADAISVLDETLFGFTIGSPNGQQVWESLAALIALRMCRSCWGQRTLRLAVRGDSVTMLSLVVNLRPSTRQLAIIGQEMAFEIAQAVFVPVIAEHVPGVANVCADALSVVPTWSSTTSTRSAGRRDEETLPDTLHELLRHAAGHSRAEQGGRHGAQHVRGLRRGQMGHRCQLRVLRHATSGGGCLLLRCRQEVGCHWLYVKEVGWRSASFHISPPSWGKHLELCQWQR